MNESIENKYLIGVAFDHEGREAGAIDVVSTDKGLAEAKQIFKASVQEEWIAHHSSASTDEAPDMRVIIAMPLSQALENCVSEQSVGRDRIERLKKDQPENADVMYTKSFG